MGWTCDQYWGDLECIHCIQSPGKRPHGRPRMWGKNKTDMNLKGNKCEVHGTGTESPPMAGLVISQWCCTFGFYCHNVNTKSFALLYFSQS